MTTPDTPRHALLFAPPREMLTQLHTSALRHWQFEIAHSLCSAEALWREAQPRVGLIPITPTIPDTPTLEKLLSQPGIEWIALIAADTPPDHTRQRLIAGAFFDHHSLPIDAPRLAHTLGHAWGRATLCDNLPDYSDNQFGMTGTSPPMRTLYRDIERVASADAPVLIGGESGTGKELVARAIARHSRRRNAPFIAVNCGAIPTSLIQSELFGHEKGAFTGANARKTGSIEAAHGGILLLDEIGDLPLEMQATLLRFLQERCITRLGSHTPVTIDARIIAATHVDLEAAVRAHRFREDLFYRLNVLSIKVPPLRARGDDIILLAEKLLHEASLKHHGCARRFSQQALCALRAHPWPGNVRELINRVQRAVIMSESRLIAPHDLGLIHPQSDPASELAAARTRLERETIENTLQRHRRNISRAARSLGISRMTLYRMMERLDIRN